MKILLVNPPQYRGVPVIREERCEVIEGSSILTPYSLLQAGALLEKKHEVKLIDANALRLTYKKLEEQLKTMEYDVLIFRFIPTSFDHDQKTAEISKHIKPDAKTIGICYSLNKVPVRVLEEAKNLDIYIGREYEVVTPDVVDNINRLEKVKGIAYRKGNKIIVNKEAKPIEDFNSLPIPAFHLLKDFNAYYISVNHGRPFTIMYTSKGCPYSCMYCNVSGSKLKLKSVDNIMKEVDFLKKHYNIRTLSFYDETFTLDEERVREICRRIGPYKIKWYCNTRTNLVTKELLKTMRKAGCMAVCYGIESGSQKILDTISKRTTVEQNARAIRWAKEANMKTHCSFIFGLPGETEETVNETLRFIKQNIPNSIEFNLATPYPGTELHKYLVKKGLIKKDRDFRTLHQESCQFENKGISKEYIEKIRKKAYRSLYLNPRWFLKNFTYLLRNPGDLVLAINYVRKVFKDLFIYDFNVGGGKR